MKYPQLVSMPSAVSDWLEEQLEARGFDSEVYTHYILSLLRTHTLDIICPEDDLSLSCFKKDGGRSAISQKRSRRAGAWWKYAHADAEQIKRSVAVECLMSASEQKCEIESLVDELCQKLKEDKFETDSSPTETNQDLEFKAELQKSKKNSPEEYYAAFPALNQKEKSSYLSSNINFVVSKWPSPEKSLDQINLIAAKWTNSGSPKKAKRKPKKQSSEPNMKSTLRSNNYKNKLGYKKANCVRKLSKEMADNMTNWDFVLNNNNYLRDHYLDFFSAGPQNNEDDVPKEQQCLPMHLLEENEGDFNEINNKNVVEHGNYEVASAPVIYNSNIWSYGSFARNWLNNERANAKDNRSATEGLYINTCDCAYCMGDYRKLKELGPQNCRAGFPTLAEPNVDNAESDDGDSAIPGEYRRDHSALSHIRWSSAIDRHGITLECTQPSAFVRYEAPQDQDKFENAPPDHPYSRRFGPPMRRPEMPPGVAVRQQEDHYFSDKVRFRVISPVRQGNLNGVYGDGGTFQEEACLEQLQYTTSPVSGLLRIAGQSERYIEPHPESLLSTRIGSNHLHSPTGPNSFKPKVRVVGNNKSCQTDNFTFLEEYTSFKTTEEPIKSQIKADYYLFMDDNVVDSWATDVVDFIIDIVPELSKMAHSENQNCLVRLELMDRMKGGALAVVNSLYEYFNIEGSRERRFYETPGISEKHEKELQDLKGDPYTPDEDSVRLPWMYKIPEIATQANINEAEADEEVRSIFYGSLQDTFNLATVEDKKEVEKLNEDKPVVDNTINNEILSSTFEKGNITFRLEDLNNIWIMPVRSSVTL